MLENPEDDSVTWTTNGQAVDEAMRFREESGHAGQASTLRPRLLNATATALVNRYLDLTPYDYSAADIVSGCLEYAMDQVFDALRYMKGVVPEGEYFEENAWGWAEEKIDAAYKKRTDADASGSTILRFVTAGGGEPLGDVEMSGEQIALIEEHAREHGLDFEEAFTSILRRGLSLSSALAAADHESDDAPLPMVDLRGLPAADRPDVALCAAGAVEPVTPPPPEPAPEPEMEPNFTLPGDPQDGKGAK